MLLIFWFFVFVKSFKEKNFDIDLTNVVNGLEKGQSARIRRSFLHGSITTGYGKNFFSVKNPNENSKNIHFCKKLFYLFFPCIDIRSG